MDGRRNGVGIILRKDLTKSVLVIRRVSDRAMGMKLEIGGMILNVLSAYAPQVGCELEEKERFWRDMDELLEGVRMEERVLSRADFNAHVGEGNQDDAEVMRKYEFGQRNDEGQKVVDFAKSGDITVVNTYDMKKAEHRITYKSGRRNTQVNYILCRRRDLKEVGDCKVVVGESVAQQHRMVVCKLSMRAVKKKREVVEPKVKWWKLKELTCQEEFREVRKGLQRAAELLEDWKTTAGMLRKVGEKVLCVTSGKWKNGKETWWWNEEVQESIKEKKEAKKTWDLLQDEVSRKNYKVARKKASRVVAKQEQMHAKSCMTNWKPGRERDSYTG